METNIGQYSDSVLDDRSILNTMIDTVDQQYIQGSNHGIGSAVPRNNTVQTLLKAREGEAYGKYRIGTRWSLTRMLSA
jgi:hypothetical protein